MLDLIGRAVLVAIFSGLAALKATVVFGYLLNAYPIHQGQYALELGSQLVGLAFMLLVVFLTLLRPKAIDSARGWEPRLSAVMGSFLTFMVPLLPQTEFSRPLQIVSLVLVVSGFTASIYVVCFLGRSLSVTPQARRLITSGPYAIVRHPLYLTEEIAVIGVILSHISLAALFLIVIQWACQLRRMSNEERILRSTFPEYASYAAKTPAIFPRLVIRLFGKRSEGVQTAV